MQVTETLNTGLKREFKVVVPARDLEAKLVDRLSNAKDKVRINGFRPGKVPVAHLRKVTASRSWLRSSTRSSLPSRARSSPSGREGGNAARSRHDRG